MSLDRRGGARRWPTACAAAVFTFAAGATRVPGQESVPAPSSLSVPFALQVGLPQGEFAENVAVAGGLGGGVLWNFGGIVGFRAEMGVMVYGSDTRRVPLGGGALGLINVDVTTTNTIFNGGLGLQLGVPGRSVSPYLGGLIGFSSFTTTSSVSGTNSNDEAFASSTNLSDGTFATTVMAGIYLPIGRGKVMLDLGVRHTWNGERVRYLTEGDISEDVNGDVVLSPRETRADLLTITLGVTVRADGSRR